MGVSAELARQHVETWSRTLRPYRKLASWPKYLFHTAHVTTAVRILGSGMLKSRSLLEEVEHDVANQGALWNNPEAHKYARLYFRPRTGFHVRTEGIKRRDSAYRQQHEMSIPIMLAFDAASVLSLPQTEFSKTKYSKAQAIGSDDRFFRSIDFEKVYHDGHIVSEKARKDMSDHRMAEVLVPGHLPLDPHLRWVICRTALERLTLLYLLGPTVIPFQKRVMVERIRQSAFVHCDLYLERLAFSRSGLTLEFHQPTGRPLAHGKYYVRVAQALDDRLVSEWAGFAPATHRVLVPLQAASSEAIWTIELEEELAYEGPIPFEQSEIV